jgi:DNA-binding MarR family transcriptional regulator
MERLDVVVPAPPNAAVAVDLEAGALDESVVYSLISDRMAHLQHTMTRLRAAVASAMGDDAEWARHRLLFMIAQSAPIRLSALAERAETDPSTLSRQVAALVKNGLIERRADPDDGRASLLVLSDAGRRVHDDQLATRNDHYRSMLADWTRDERVQFAALLDRFVRDYDSYKSAFVAAATRSLPPRSDHETDLNYPTETGESS